MKKRMAINLLILCLLLAALAPAVSATEIEREPGWCGDDLTWTFEEGTLTISGSGAMDDYTGDAPWAAHKNDITAVVFSGDVTYIGARAFRNYDSLETVDFGSAMYEIGTEAFTSCDGLVSIELPASFKIFGEGSFMSCKNLKEIHCAGRFPSFKENCLWDSYVTIYYPAANPWNVETIAQLEEAFKGRVQFLASDGSDHYEPTEEVTEPVETEPEITEPETIPPTETVPPVTEPEETQQMTEPVVTETETAPTEMPTEAEPTEPASSASGLDGISKGMIIIGAVLGLVVLGALVFSGKFRSRGRYSK